MKLGKDAIMDVAGSPHCVQRRACFELMAMTLKYSGTAPRLRLSLQQADVQTTRSEKSCCGKPAEASAHNDYVIAHVCSEITAR